MSAGQHPTIQMEAMAEAVLASVEQPAELDYVDPAVYRELEDVASMVALAGPTDGRGREVMRAELISQLRSDAADWLATHERAARPQRSRAWITAAAAVLLVAFTAWMFLQFGLADEARPARLAELRLWVNEQDDAVQQAWQDSPIDGSASWSDAAGVGVVTLINAPVNDPAEMRYTVWAFDGEQWMHCSTFDIGSPSCTAFARIEPSVQIASVSRVAIARVAANEPIPVSPAPSAIIASCTF